MSGIQEDFEDWFGLQAEKTSRDHQLASLQTTVEETGHALRVARVELAYWEALAADREAACTALQERVAELELAKPRHPPLLERVVNAVLERVARRL